MGRIHSWRRWSDGEDALLLALTAAGHDDASLAVLLGHTVPSIRARRQTLGLTQPRAALWTTQEEWRLVGLLEEGRTDREIAARLGRSPRALQQRAARLRVNRRTARGWTLQRVAGLLGVDWHTVRWWVRQGLLAARPTGNLRRRGPERAITSQEMRRFLAEESSWYFWRPETITDRRWRYEAQERRTGSEFIGAGEAARRLHVHPVYVNKLCRAGHLEARKRGPNWVIRADGGRLRLPAWQPRRARGPWLSADQRQAAEAVLRAEWGRVPARALARRLGRSESWVHKAARRLGLPCLGRGVWKQRRVQEMTM